MKSFRDRSGFTIIELMTVVAIVGFLVAMAFPSLKRYRQKEITRSSAKQVSSWVSDARSQAIASGRMTFLLLEAPTNGLFPFQDGQFAELVTDVNGNNAVDENDAARQLYLPGDATKVVKYDADANSFMGSIFIPDDDLSDRVPVAKLNDIQSGSTLPMDAALGVSAVAFSPQGAPVAPDTPAEWGTGAGGIYLTDDESLALAILVMPLGEVKVLVADPASNEWK